MIILSDNLCNGEWQESDQEWYKEKSDYTEESTLHLKLELPEEAVNKDAK